MTIPKLYKKYNVDKDYTSIGLFRELKKQFNISKAFYPGSYVHLTPSLIFPNVTYADSFRNTKKFWDDIQTQEYIFNNKEYPEEPTVKFYQQDFHQPFTKLNADFDLLISQYAGFVGQAAKKYLKPNGILVCNNSHGDGSMASLDPDYKLVAVYKRVSDTNFRITDNDLRSYLIPKSGVQPSHDQLTTTMKGIAYTKSPSGYIFMKVR